MKPIYDATPLIAANAVVFDTETTGLDVKEARILQIGGMALVEGRLKSDDTFDTLVDPGVAVPPRSTAIHGITGQMLRTAPSFAEAWRRFEEYRRGRLLIGYALGFDLAILEREAARASFLWQAPRTLCVRMLAGIVNPDLPDSSLDAIAAWLAVATEGRHSAGADARIAGEIFVALVPHLIAMGIRTVAEAERASSLRSQVLRQHAEAGWSEPFLRQGDPSRRALGVIDPYAFRHRVMEAANSRPVVTRDDATIHEAARIMADKRISSLLLSQNAAPGGPTGNYAIVTERDIMRAVAASGAKALDKPVNAIATRPVVCVAHDAFFYEALGLMNHKRIRHLVVADAEGRLTGVLSARDFLRFRAGAAVDLQTRITEASTPADLAAAWSRVPVVASALLDEEIDARTITEVISGILCALTARASEIALDDMRTAGEGEAPCPFCVLVLGSGGRGESLLAPDQDNAVIFEEGAPDSAADRWFARFGKIFTDHLHAAAIPLCKGGVMARNAAWRSSADEWRRRVDAWVAKARPADLLNVDIFYDLRGVYGDEQLAADLRSHAWERGAERTDFAKLLGETARDVANPFTLLGGLRLKEGRLDLKLYGLFPIVSAARALAIHHNILRASTRDRLSGLAELPGMPRSDLATLRDAHGFFLSLILDQQVADIAVGVPPGNSVVPGRLSDRRQKTLKEALKSAGIIPDLVRSAMFR